MKKSKRTTYRKKVRRVRKNRGKKTQANFTRIRGVNPVSDRTFVKLRYSQTLGITSTGGALATNLFRGNSLFDPDYTGTGHQPLGFDQWALFYSKYMVLGSKITCRFVNESTSVCEFSISPRPQVTIPGVGPLQEKGYTKRKLCSPSGQNVYYLSDYCTVKKALGMNRLDIGDNSYAADVTGNPSDGFYWLVANNTFDGSGTTTVRVQVDIVYYVCFFLRQSLSAS